MAKQEDFQYIFQYMVPGRVERSSWLAYALENLELSFYIKA